MKTKRSKSFWTFLKASRSSKESSLWADTALAEAARKCRAVKKGFKTCYFLEELLRRPNKKGLPRPLHKNSHDLAPLSPTATMVWRRTPRCRFPLQGFEIAFIPVAKSFVRFVGARPRHSCGNRIPETLPGSRFPRNHGRGRLELPRDVGLSLAHRNAHVVPDQ